MNNLGWPLVGIIAEWQGTTFSALPWHIKPSIPLAFEGELDVNSLLTVDEGREEIGKKPFSDEKGKQLIKAVGGKAGTPAGTEPTGEKEEPKPTDKKQGGSK